MTYSPLRAFLLTVMLACVAWSLPAAALGQTSVLETLTVQGTQSGMQGQQAGAAGGQAAPGQQQPAAQSGSTAAAPAAAATPATPLGAGAGSEPVFLLSPIKPILVLLVLIGWAWVVSNLDKDAAYYYLQRYSWNLGQMACGVVGFGLMLLIPFFAIGFIIGLLVLAGGVLGYAYYRNTKVPEGAQWTLSLDSFRQRVEGYQHRQAQKSATLVLLSKDEQRLEVPTGEDPRALAHQTLEAVIDFAVPRGADVIQVAVDPQAAALNARIDGVYYPQGQLEPKTGLVLIDYLKEIAGLDLKDRRKRQHGSVKIDAGELGRHTLEIETAGSTRGVNMIMHIDGQQRKRMPLKLLGLLDSQRQQVADMVAQKGKVVILTSAPAQGLSTTLYSLISEHDPYTTSLTTLEDEVLFELEGVTHNEVGGVATSTMNERLASMIRSDPGVVMIARPLEAETAQLIAKNSEEIRYYIQMPDDDTFTALGRWMKLTGSKRLAAEALGAIVAQKLVRKLCTTCRTPYKPDPAALRKLNLPADRVGTLFHSSGQVMDRDKAVQCPDCMGLGYKGRVGVFEIMAIDDAARALLAKGDLDGLRSHLRKNKMLWLQEAGLAKVVEGVTDVKEITRALGKPGSGGSQAKPAA